MNPVTQSIQVEAFVDGSALSEVSEKTGIAIAQYTSWFQTWLADLNPQISPLDAYEVSLRLTFDDEIQQLNADFRQQPNPTDVLSFAALETEMPQSEHIYCHQPVYLGDIIISIETAARQASESQHSLERELAWLCAHGLLHLLGWDHPDEDSLIKMLDRQALLLKLVF
ncbi:rRNA maturation RNase YbeY [cf. Phormidesmis sp. LEGE 11477]|uniref:rRNA maturation RNase YbeY n=1 Tax=cf. Phormidesmis sp. LEGE 11477 TaxID=1828680 RepID=UPI001882E4CB|nr:rRNA maturation RNase YbeY [cf. Phormidesmis sp. LEGE 11477]MBE9060187.1 rRNA maturation RNase YbeY [cf. Phormidesmis sp. LEGE 11477]